MGEIEEFPFSVGLMPHRFGKIDDDISAILPGGEQADFGFSLWPDRSFEKADAGMTASRIGEDDGDSGPRRGDSF